MHVPRILVKSERKRPLGKPICMWLANIKTNLRYDWRCADWIVLA
jgi:hypothetical protein